MTEKTYAFLGGVVTVTNTAVFVLIVQIPYNSSQSLSWHHLKASQNMYTYSVYTVLLAHLAHLYLNVLWQAKMSSNKNLSNKVAQVNPFTSVCSYNPVTYFLYSCLGDEISCLKLSEKQTQCSASQSALCNAPSISQPKYSSNSSANMHPMHSCCHL